MSQSGNLYQAITVTLEDGRTATYYGKYQLDGNGRIISARVSDPQELTGPLKQFVCETMQQGDPPSGPAQDDL